MRQLIVDGDGVSLQDVADDLTRAASDRVLFLTDGGATARLITLTAAAQPASVFLVPGALATDDVLRVSPSAMPRIFVALPSVPADQSPAARRGTARLPATTACRRRTSPPSSLPSAPPRC